jgi:hypothetical protein
VQHALDKLPGRSLQEASAVVLDATGEVEQVNITGRGIYRKTAAIPSPTELSRRFAFADAGGTIWAKPVDRICRASEYGIVSHESFDEGGAWTGTPVDQAPLLQDLLHRIKEKGGGTLRFDRQCGAIPLGSSVVVPAGVDLDGVSAGFTPLGTDFLGGLRFMPTAEGQFFDATGVPRSVANDGHCQQGILFWANIDPANPDTWLQEYPGVGSGTFRNLNIDGQMTGGIKGIRFAGSYRFRDIRCLQVGTLIEKPNLYTDGVVIESVEAFLRANDTDYLVYLPGLGDAMKIDGLSTGYIENQNGLCRGLYLGSVRSAVVAGTVNGIHQIKGGSGVLVLPSHQEGGYWIIDESDVTFEGGALYNGKGAPQAPIVVKNSNSVNRFTCRVTINDVMFNHILNPVADLDGWGDSPLLDIDIQSERTQVIGNGGNRRVMSVSGQVDVSWQTAPTIGDSTAGGVFPGWKNYAPMLATQGFAIINQQVTVTGTMPSRAENWSGLSAATFTPVAGVNGVAYKGVTGANTYLARPLYDPDRLLGRAPTGSATITIPVTSGAATLPGFFIDNTKLSTIGAVLWEVLRDTGNDGNYDKRALVPGIDLNAFVDDGNAVCGFAWEAFGPGAAATINNNGYTCRFEYNDGLLRILDSGAVSNPTVGNWKVGDMLFWPSNPPDGNSMKTVSSTCRTAGAPGTWDVQRISTVSPAV